MDILTEIRQRLGRHGADVALKHLDQAEASFAAGNWEAANSQIRTFLEALFDTVAAVRLKTSLTKGAARKRLAEQGVLSERESKVVQSFMDWAGEQGSHAGISSAELAASRRLVGLGMALLALSLLPELVRVEVLVRQLKAPPGTELPGDSEITTCCPTCGASQNLSEADIRRQGEETVYVCKNGCQPIVVVGLPGDSPWPGRGYRLGSHVIRNAKDLYLPVIGSDKVLLVPASPGALMKKLT